MQRTSLFEDPHDDTVPEQLSLLVGLAANELPPGYAPHGAALVESLPYILLHAALARAPMTDHVVSPLVCEHFDAMDLASELESVGFEGTYTVIVPPLPRPDIVRRELCQIAPRVDIDLQIRVCN